MKSFFITPLVLILSFIGSVAPAQAGQISIQNVDIMTWPTNLPASKALDIYIEIMNSDLEISSILYQVNTKLQAHRVNSIREIFNYCEGEPPAPGATAFFRQNSNIVETRISIPGFPENPWSDSVLEMQKSAFSSKVIKTPFIEFLALSERPEICIHRGKQLFSAYDSVVHEMTHFLMKDPFSYYAELLSSEPFPDFVAMTVTEVGGELDAFKIGSSAGIRFFKKYSIQGYSSESHQFFNTDGLLTDADGLKNYLIKIYSALYKDSSTINDLKDAKQKMVNTKLSILKGNVAPVLRKLNRPDLQKVLDDEIAVLEKLRLHL